MYYNVSFLVKCIGKKIQSVGRLIFVGKYNIKSLLYIIRDIACSRFTYILWENI